MAELEQGTIIKLLNGKTCTVDSELGRGGQGIVYLVDYCGGDFALKCIQEIIAIASITT